MKGVAGGIAVIVAVIGIVVLAIRVTAAASATPLPLGYGFDGGSGWHHGKIKPHAIYFGTGGSLLIRGVSWTSWTQNAAIGNGVRWANSCVPNCAAGAYAKSRTVLTLSKVKVHEGIRYFSELTVLWMAGDRHHTTVFRWAPGVFRGLPFWS